VATEQENPSLRDALEAAIAEAEGDAGQEVISGQDDTPREASQAAAAAETEVSDTRASSPGTDDHPTAAGSGAAEPGDDAFVADEAYPDDATRYAGLTAQRVAKPPAGWRPAAREGWDKLTEAQRREIHRRELDITAGLNGSAESRKAAERFQRAVEPYRAVLASEGITDPVAGVERLLNTASVLKMGTAEQKAKRVAELVAHYGVDLDALDNALSASLPGAAAPAKAPQAAIPPELDARLRPIEQMLQRQAQAQQTQFQTALDAFAKDPKHEFFSDVAADMADLMSLAAQRGRSLSMEQAYQAACQANPAVASVIASRARMQQGARVASKEATADVVRANGQVGTGPGPGQSTGSLRDDIARAYDAVVGGG